MNCSIHPHEPASPDCDGWTVQLCDTCMHACGYPSQEPLFGSLYGIGAVVLLAEEQRQTELREHPEVLAYTSHPIHPAQVAG